MTGGINALLASSGVRTEERRVELLPDGARMIYLHAGDLYASQQASQITTILGSCVSVCLWDRLTRVAGINHFMLPNDFGEQSQTLRYANYSMTELLRQIAELGADRRRLEAKVFGGASVLASAQSGRDLGAKNVDVARERLRQERIKITAEDVGGMHGRKLVFRTWDGSVLLKQV